MWGQEWNEMMHGRRAPARSQKALYTMPRNIDFIPCWGAVEGVLAGELYAEIYALEKPLWYLSKGWIWEGKSRSSWQWGGCATEQEGCYAVSHPGDKRRRCTQENKREANSSRSGDYLDLWSEKGEDERTPTLATSVTTDANTEEGVSVRKRRDTVLFLARCVLEGTVGQLRGYAQMMAGC